MSTLRELVQALYAAADDIHGEIDRQTYDEKRRGDFDLPDEYEYSVTITAAQERALSKAIIGMAKALSPYTDQPGSPTFDGAAAWEAYQNQCELERWGDKVEAAKAADELARVSRAGYADGIFVEAQHGATVSPDLPRSDLLDKTLRQYAHDCVIAACTAWSDVRDANGDLNQAKCEVAASKERCLKAAINELAAKAQV